MKPNFVKIKIQRNDTVHSNCVREQHFGWSNGIYIREVMCRSHDSNKIQLARDIEKCSVVAAVMMAVFVTIAFWPATAHINQSQLT